MKLLAIDFSTFVYKICTLASCVIDSFTLCMPTASAPHDGLLSDPFRTTT